MAHRLDCMVLFLVGAALLGVVRGSNDWKQVGPWNIGDDVNIGGEAGMLMDAASPFGNPNVIYTGGNKNGGSTGVFKSVDKGKHWFKASNGLFDARVRALFIVDADQNGDHVLCGTSGGLYETFNGAANWTLVKTPQYGEFNSFRNGTIQGKPYILAGTVTGVANRPLQGGDWNLIPTPPGHAAFHSSYLSASDSLPSSTVGGCIWPDHTSGVVHVGTIINETAADWKFWPNATCQNMALDPNDPKHFIHVNNSHGLTTWETTDGGITFHQLVGDRGVYYVAIDRKGWLYSAGEPGAYRSRDKGKTWEAHFVRRVQRRTNKTVDRIAHDYNRIILDFAGGMAFPADQGLFFPDKDERLQLYSACGDMNNNLVLMHSVAEGEEPNSRYIVTALWDWSPVASWDGGEHWPSWQTPDDGPAPSFIGEGGGAFGIGKSKHSLIIHHHNIAYSSRGGKNMSRFVVPNGASVGPTIFSRKAGSRSVPNGPVFALMNMGQPPWGSLIDKAITCTTDEHQGDLGVMTNYTCLANVDTGVAYNWYPGVNYAVWNADGSKHCVVCNLTGDPSTWAYTDKPGAISYPTTKTQGHDDDEEQEDDHESHDDSNESIARARREEFGEEHDVPKKVEVSSGGHYIIKSPNFGLNWTWTKLPAALGGINLQVDPTDNSVLYGSDANCIYRSHDQGDTWGPCEKGQGLEGDLGRLGIKDSKTFVMMRSGEVPLRTRDGGGTWTALDSVAEFAHCVKSAQFSWSGNTLVLHGSDSGAPARGEYAACVFVSRDDGDTWVEETGDITTMNLGGGQWYEDTFYMSTYGQGVISKVLEPAV